MQEAFGWCWYSVGQSYHSYQILLKREFDHNDTKTFLERNK
jgi:hypothetical protein